jgi:hypothetical protein
MKEKKNQEKKGNGYLLTIYIQNKCSKPRIYAPVLLPHFLYASDLSSILICHYLVTDGTSLNEHCIAYFILHQ